MSGHGRRSDEDTKPDADGSGQFDRDQSRPMQDARSPAPGRPEHAAVATDPLPQAAQRSRVPHLRGNLPVLRSATVTEERRHDERQPASFEIEFTDDSEFFAGVSQDLSRGGVFVATYQLLPVGSAVGLSLELPDGERVEVRGEVRWLRESSGGEGRPGMGVAFRNLSTEALARINAFCARRPPLLYEEVD